MIIFYELDSVNIFLVNCVSKGIVSPLTSKLKCPHGRREDTDESEAVTEVACDGFGGGRKDHLEGGGGEIVLKLMIDLDKLELFRVIRKKSFELSLCPDG